MINKLAVAIRMNLMFTSLFQTHSHDDDNNHKQKNAY